MSYSRDYRKNAADERQAAEDAKLPEVAARHLMLARRWDEIADELDRLSNAVVANATETPSPISSEVQRPGQCDD
ncbi:hypothetical protein [Croceicoccus marinus]|uniref:Uncharacterized protein n=1 Tax=Croceicoccus marinus TaxID=450378 RepID=A0A7G6VW95_9SPHN|nr:hypothetical protein [Croceicoccus marinus]QNE06010.1 hypothetical protein H4O24_05025 [Croceicoccus marinus]